MMMQVESSTALQHKSFPEDRLKKAILNNPHQITAELCRRSLFYFMKEFWDEVSHDAFKPNWHIELFCSELQAIAERVAENKPKLHDLIVNVPPGTTKTTTFMIMFPIWCWLRWYWMKFITASYSGALSLESAEYSRDLIRSEKFRACFPELAVKADKDTKSNFRVIKRFGNGITSGGNRYSTSVGGTLTGFHGHILLIDDPLDPNRAVSEVEIANANRWIDQTLSTRKIDKAVTPTILIMQRLHSNDPSGYILSKKKANIKHISLPGEIKNYGKFLKPANLASKYINGLLDPERMNWDVLKDMEADLGQYGYAGQVGQTPTPPGGGMFKVEHFQIVHQLPPSVTVEQIIRYWDKAGSEGKGAYTVGLKMYKLKANKFLIADVKRGRWSTEERERIIRETAIADGRQVQVYFEQEPGSGGKESAEATIRNLTGFSAHADRPTGDKIYRADPYSVQVNNGNVHLLQGEWNHELIEEYRFFPFSTYKDQVDAGSGAFNILARERKAGMLFKGSRHATQ
ncbi:MAG: phage terminase large subunit [Thermodesulfobacteriota bacterium]|nr:phage terminase large subunit [Thermodesulfobacteriota bacterium]